MKKDVYQATLERCTYFPLEGVATLRLTGEDRLAFLQRQTSNDLRSLQPGMALSSPLTSPTGRILDVLCVLNEADALIAFTLPGFGSKTAQFLKSRIFFMDKVRLSDESATVVNLDILGPAAIEALAAMGVSQPPQPSQVVPFSTGDGEGKIIGMPRSLSPGYRMVLPLPDRQLVEQELEKNGAFPLSEELYSLRRIEEGLPSAGRELSVAFTPLEVGLAELVSGAKGCFTGQEVLARQVNRDKITQKLYGLRLEKPSQAGQLLWAGERPAGVVTSAAESPRFGPIALAVIKRPFDQPGQKLAVGEAPGAGIWGKIAELPFR